MPKLSNSCFPWPLPEPKVAKIIIPYPGLRRSVCQRSISQSRLLLLCCSVEVFDCAVLESRSSSLTSSRGRGSIELLRYFRLLTSRIEFTPQMSVAFLVSKLIGSVEGDWLLTWPCLVRVKVPHQSGALNNVQLVDQAA